MIQRLLTHHKNITMMEIVALADHGSIVPFLNRQVPKRFVEVR